ncbi:hypothetical protein [Candidatus Babela massiliensis]|uniref:Uncharacterized protein n=1 Tax=Candidatus Babela massiliensis TaxID=673862 RepID=V6DF49_9BACT|nr:hypothetical protein [Candidatus Babela massiliensis]CDK30200.1 hypothetical protein BABL1_gene_894 [Candidatus Babela massiliensis]
MKKKYHVWVEYSLIAIAILIFLYNYDSNTINKICNHIARHWFYLLSLWSINVTIKDLDDKQEKLISDKDDLEYAIEELENRIIVLESKLNNKQRD